MYIKMVKIMKLPLLLMVFVKVHIHFRKWTRIRKSSGSGSTTLVDLAEIIRQELATLKLCFTCTVKKYINA
jgi:hypothetical protein